MNWRISSIGFSAAPSRHRFDYDADFRIFCGAYAEVNGAHEVVSGVGGDISVLDFDADYG
jgi:hypothetical protein